MKEYPKPQIIEGDFLKVINKAIKEKRHVDYLQQVLKNYDKYKKFFENNAFISYNPRGYIYQFKVIYRQDSKVWQIIEVKGNQALEDLAEFIIETMGWVNDHMHRFAYPDKALKTYQFAMSRYEIFFDGEDWDDDPFPTLKTNQVRIDDINYETFPKLFFEFDFGDSHEFDIELIKIRGPKIGEVKASFPRLLKENGKPPEQYPNYDDGAEDEEMIPIEDDQVFQEFVHLTQAASSKQCGFNEKTALDEYFKLHDKLPKNITDTDIKNAIKVLQTDEQKLESIKLSVLILAHAGSKEALKALDEFRKKATRELIFWVNTAISECSLFMK